MSISIVYGTKPERMPWRVIAADGTILAGAPSQAAAQQTASQMRGPVRVVSRGESPTPPKMEEP